MRRRVPGRHCRLVYRLDHHLAYRLDRHLDDRGPPPCAGLLIFDSGPAFLSHLALKRHGTTTLFAVLDVLTWRVLAQCKPRHRHQSFSASCARSKRQCRPISTCTSSSTTTPRTSTRRSRRGWRPVRAGICTSCRPTVRGSTWSSAHHHSRDPWRVVPLGTRTGTAHRPLCDSSQCQLQTLYLDRDRRFDHRQTRKTLCTNQRNGTLAS
jgi:hypothetical protein